MCIHVFAVSGCCCGTVMAAATRTTWLCPPTNSSGPQWQTGQKCNASESCFSSFPLLCSHISLYETMQQTVSMSNKEIYTASFHKANSMVQIRW